MRTTYETVRLEIDADRVALLTLNRPDASNAMTTIMMEELRGIFAALYVDPTPIAALVVTGAGEKAFCAGADLKERRGMTDEVWRRQHAILEQAVRALMECPVPVIAAVNGAAYAGGLEIALGCDFIYAVDTARFALTEVGLGIMPGAAGTQNLPRAIGIRRAKEIIMTGTPFTAREGEAWGLVNRVTAPGKVVEEALATARRIAANAPVSVRQVKKSIDRSADLDRQTGYAFEIEAYNRTIVTEDRAEGINAFNEKRKPRFKGR